MSLSEKLTHKLAEGFSKNDYIVLRNGSINNSYDVEAEMKLFQQLQYQNSEIKFLFLNQGQHQQLLSLIEKFGLEKNRYKLLAADFNQIVYYLNMVDLCVFFVKPSFAKQASAPTKFAENVACYLNSITNIRYGDMEYYLSSYQVGLLLDLQELDQNPVYTARKIIEFMEKHRENQVASYQQFDQLFAKHFSKEIAVERYQRIYDDLNTLAEL